MSHNLLTLRAFSSQLKRFRLLFVAFGSILLFSVMAHASIIPTLSAGPINVGNGLFRYDYTITLSADERLDPAATNGVTCPGPSNSNVQCNPPGTFVTFYDIPGFRGIGVTPNPSFQGGSFNGSSQNVGPTPNSINGAAFDSPTVLNVTFTYMGPVIIGPATFTGFSIFSTFGGTPNPVGNFTSQSTNNTASVTSGTSDQVIGSVPIPMAPTAASVAVGGRVMTESGRGIRGVVITMTDQNGNVRRATTGSFGYYQFSDTEVGQTYTFSIRAKNYNFQQQTQLLSLSDETNEVNFYGTAAFR